MLRRGGALGPSVLVVPRAECAYRRFDFAHLQEKQRPGAARLAAMRHEPVAGAPFHIAWTAGIAHVWWWLEAPDPGSAPATSWIPESVLRGPPPADGARLLAMLRGFEGQGWTDGRLACSQWWPRVPDVAQWAKFTRGCGISAAAVPEPVDAAIAPRAWGDGRSGLGAVPPAVAEGFAWRGLAVLFALLLGWQLTGLGYWSYVAGQTEARLESLRSSSTPLLDARDRAEGARAELERLAALQTGVDDQFLMVEVARRLPEEDMLAGWEREGNALRFAVRTSDIDPRTYVAALEGIAGVDQLQASPEAGAMRIELELASRPVAGALPAGDGGGDRRDAL